jgi:hypothetical protein
MHEKWEMNIKLQSKNLKGRDQSEDIGLNRRIILKWILEK